MQRGPTWEPARLATPHKMLDKSHFRLAAEAQ